MKNFPLKKKKINLEESQKNKMIPNCELPREKQIELIKKAIDYQEPTRFQNGEIVGGNNCETIYAKFQALKYISPAIIHPPVKFTGAYNKYGAKYSN